ncbi:hypothetical protein DL765_003690 [Monosporascus sp. GIB2]|nr:hypothetical protein DL765_003690 [Monosporascus sp. GIB2]
MLGTTLFLLGFAVGSLLCVTYRSLRAARRRLDAHSCFAAEFPLALTPLYHNLGVGPGSGIFAGFACLLIPVPYLFYVFGRTIQAANKWTKASMYD